MPQTTRDIGTYALGEVVSLEGGFKYTASGNVLDTFRDGHSTIIKSVTRVSAGLYEITFDDYFPIPEKCFGKRAWLCAGQATAGKACTAEVVEGTYSQTTRKFRIKVTVAADVALSAYADPTVGDPDDQSRIEFCLRGSINSAGTDNA